MALYTEDERRFWEVEKLKAETSSLSRPFRQPAMWLAVVGLAASVAGNFVQHSSADRERQLSEIKHEKLDLDTTKLEQKEKDLDSQIQLKQQTIKDFEKQVQEAQNQLAGIKNDISRAPANPEALGKALNQLQATTQNLESISSGTAQDLSKPISTNSQGRDLNTAREMEQSGFRALAQGDFETAQNDFQRSEDAANGYHASYELARLLRTRRADLKDPDKRKEVLRIVLKKYGGYAPPEIQAQLQQQSK